MVVEVDCSCFLMFFYVCVLVEDVIGILLFWLHDRNKTCLFVALVFLASGLLGGAG